MCFFFSLLSYLALNFLLLSGKTIPSFRSIDHQDDVDAGQAVWDRDAKVRSMAKRCTMLQYHSTIPSYEMNLIYVRHAVIDMFLMIQLINGR
jgi:hypothetical protein